MDSFYLTIFGVTGNLAQIKIIPTLYDLMVAKILPESFRIVGVGRSPMTDDEFRKYFSEVVHRQNRHHEHAINEAIEEKLLASLAYVSGDFEDPQTYQQLNGLLGSDKSCQNRMYYLATFPNLYASIFNNLEAAGLNKSDCGWIRVIIEKPIGHNLVSCQELDRLLTKYYVEDQIYRLDHYLGKETLQNVLTFRFGNGLFEHLLEKDYVDHIQITASEDFGVEKRGSYYDPTGALRDVGQNHLLQMLTLAAMDSPAEFTNLAVTKQRIRLLESLVPDPTRVVFGQYEGYRGELNVAPDSKTDTYFAFRTFIESDRFRQVPIYVRGGKKLQRTATEITIVFKNPVHRIFGHLDSGLDPNVLIYRIQPNEGIVLRFLSKIPGHELKLQESYMQFCYHEAAGTLPDAYERLIADVIRGDQTFFNDAAEVEAQWKFTDSLIAARPENIEVYPAGSWGPKCADELLAADGRRWLEPSTAFCQI